MIVKKKRHRRKSQRYWLIFILVLAVITLIFLFSQPKIILEIKSGVGNVIKGIRSFITGYAIIQQTGCGTLSEANTEYNLTNGVSSAGICFNIIANNVTINGNGYLINYSQSTAGYAIYSTANFTKIKNLRIEQGSSSAFSHAVYLKNNRDNTIENNTITTFGMVSSGIYLYANSNNTIENNKITTSGSSSHGIFLSNSHNNILSNDKINTTGSVSNGVHLAGNNSNNSLTNMDIQTSNNLAHAIYVFQYGNSSFTIRDSLLNASYAYVNDTKFGAQTSGLVNFTNVSFDDVGFESSSNTQLNVQWWLDVLVKDTLGGPIEGAEVKYINPFTQYFSSKFTDAEGKARQELLYYKQNATEKLTFPSHLINVSKQGYVYSQETVPMIRNQFEEFTLEEDCRILDQPNTDYTLKNDVNSSSTCFSITANNVTLDCQGHNIIYGNQDIATAYYGIYSNYNETKIKNCTITTTYPTRPRYGVYYYNSNKSSIENINSSNNMVGIYLIGISNNLLTNITSNSNSYYGIYFYLSTNNNLNNIITSSNSWHGIYLTVSSNNILTDITSNSNSKYGLYLFRSSNNTFRNLNIWDCSTGGTYSCIFFESNSNNNVLENVYVNKSSKYGIHFLSGSNTNPDNNNIFRNIKIENTQNYSVYLQRGFAGKVINNSFINATYSTEYLSDISGNLELIRKWYLDVNVSNSTSLLEYANVKAWNVTGAEIFSEFTNTTGKIATKELIQYVNNGTKNYHTPYTINITKSGYVTNSTKTDLTDNLWLGIQLDIEEVDVIPPSIEFKSPTPIDGTTQPEASVEINVSINESTLGEVKFNWNGVNYTFYNDSLVLMYNFDNISAIGDSNTKVVDVSKYSNNGTLGWSCTGTATACDGLTQTQCGDTLNDPQYGCVWDSGVESCLGIPTACSELTIPQCPNQLVCNLNIAKYVTGKYGKGIQFDGDDYINTGNSESLNISGNTLSIEVWIYPIEIKTMIVAGKSEMSKNDYVIAITEFDNKIDFNLYNGTSEIYEFFSNTVIPLNEWTYVVGTYNGSEARIYINGILDNTKSFSGNIAGTEKNFMIGARADGHYFNGTIDEIRIYNRSLSADEINQLYMSNLYKYDKDKWALYVNYPKLSLGTYTYFGCAKDKAENENCTEARSLTISYTIIDSGRTDGGGGGDGGAPTTKKYFLTLQECNSGSSKDLSSGDSIVFPFENQNYTIRLIGITQNKTKIKILNSSEVTLPNGDFELNVNEDIKYELNQDNYYDVLIKFEALSDSKAKIFINCAHILISEKPGPKTNITVLPDLKDIEKVIKKPFKFPLTFIIIVSLFALLVFGVFFLTKKIIRTVKAAKEEEKRILEEAKKKGKIFIKQ